MQTTNLKHIALMAEFCAKNGVSEVVISPGSRNAPLIIAFETHPDINTHLIHDERCAGFYALGLSEALGKPVALTCTSGSALLNYAPALVEAYYRQIPLIVFSADRPAHLIDQGDGQTIRQTNVFQNFVKASLVYPESGEAILIEAQKILSAAFHQLLSLPKGPVHLNVPLDEPLYGTETFNATSVETVIPEDIAPLNSINLNEIREIWQNAEKKLILIGQHEPDGRLESIISLLAANPSVAVLVENTSNIKDFRSIVHCIDRTLAVITEDELESFAPDLLISTGGAIISKRIKAYFRKYKVRHTWRVGKYLINEDTFQSLSRALHVDPVDFLEHLVSVETVPQSNFGGKWKQKDLIAQERHQQFMIEAPFSDLTAFDLLLDVIPDDAVLHMGNSSVIRYCQLFDPVKGTRYYSNRGVSGIDGSSSTAAGFSVVNQDQLNVLISGDISFFYDSNAFWNDRLKDNLKIVVISNGGGGIFQFIPGPAESSQSQTFFAPTTASVKGICDAYDLNFYQVKDLHEIHQAAAHFFSREKNGRPAVLEICTQGQENAEVLKAYFNHMSQA